MINFHNSTSKRKVEPYSYRAGQAQSAYFKIKRKIRRDSYMLWYSAETRETETSYILITRQQPVEMSILLYKVYKGDFGIPCTVTSFEK